ncbi:D-alanyl-D-alanine carboxypeptidase/D-alanyl-D-alanine-endopeptidase [Nocardioides sp.]|uniref:D-alanyl-D-alanine carboxypeptidase/D-alanyl-D-alanine endopeptidase n=1 Tax=Nocardioides sp. TaxID=35761 RepID=UPI0035616608
MAGRDPRHGTAAILRWLPVVLVLILLAAAGASYRFELGPRWLGTGPDPADDPAAVAPPVGLALPTPVEPAEVAAALGSASASDDRGLDVRRLQRLIRPLLDDPDLGPRVRAAVTTLDDPTTVYRSGRGPAIPASTLKLLTGTAVLATLGPEHVFTTTVRSGPGNRIVLVGGGDPLLASEPVEPGDTAAYPASADMLTLARATAEALRERGTRRVRLAYDDTLFTGPAVSPRWPETYLPGVVTPISSLWVDQGRSPTGSGRVADPSAAAAEEFARALGRFRIRVLGEPRPRRADPDAETLAGVESAPLAAIVERMVSLSDNEAAEVLLRHVGLAVRGEGSFTAGVRAARATLADLGVPFAGARWYDGSGLSRENRLTSETLLETLRVAADPDRPELRAVLTGLPVAGFTGSLAVRFEDAVPRGRGLVRAKTGTLTGVSSLAGLVTDRHGQLLLFVLMADRVAVTDTLAARDALDRMAAALATCRCAA